MLGRVASLSSMRSIVEILLLGFSLDCSAEMISFHSVAWPESASSLSQINPTFPRFITSASDLVSLHHTVPMVAIAVEVLELSHACLRGSESSLSGYQVQLSNCSMPTHNLYCCSAPHRRAQSWLASKFQFLRQAQNWGDTEK